MAELDRERILGKVDELDSYLAELKQIAPVDFVEFQKIEKKRACERLLQLAVESVIDICNLLVSGLRMGLPAEEEDLFRKLIQGHIISEGLGKKLKEMKGFRNILVHEYARVNDKIVYEAVKTKFSDFDAFKKEILDFLREHEVNA